MAATSHSIGFVFALIWSIGHLIIGCFKLFIFGWKFCHIVKPMVLLRCLCQPVSVIELLYSYYVHNMKCKNVTPIQQNLRTQKQTNKKDKTKITKLFSIFFYLSKYSGQLTLISFWLMFTFCFSILFSLTFYITCNYLSFQVILKL